MDGKELKKIVAKYLAEGLDLPEIQDKLAAEHEATMTFLDLRLLAAEIEDVDWTKGEVEEPAPDEKTEDDIDSTPPGTNVEIDRITRPGVALSGSVQFASGASAEWALDQFGRLTFEKQTGKPTQQDMVEFQEEIQQKLGGAR
jgi:hypothetical protein